MVRWLTQGLKIRRHPKRVPVRLRPRAPTTNSRKFKRRQKADPDFSELSRYPHGRNKTKTPKSLLLPMAAQSAREVSLAHHLALVACRGDSGNRHQINELVRSIYRAYYLQRMGFGELPFECYEHAEAVFQNALAVAAKSATRIISEQDAAVLERLLTLEDQQLSQAPMHRVVEAEKELRQFLAGTGASPLVRSKMD